MTSSRQNTVTNNVEQRQVVSVGGSVGRVVGKKRNPHWQLWQDFIANKVSSDELHRILRGKLLKSVHKFKKQKYPPEPTVIKNGKGKLPKSEIESIMQGWGEACEHVNCVNAGNKYWLGLLLSDIVEGKLEAEQGKEEEIEELLSEWY